MNNLDKQYTALLQDILDNGTTKQDRTGTGTLSVFGKQIRHKMSEGFPLITTKKMPFRLIATELMWFLRGDTNIKYLVDNDCHIWDGDAYKRYADSHTSPPSNPGGPLLSDNLCSVRPMAHSKESFIEAIKTDDEFAKKWGELGPIYGKQWRSWETYFDKTKGWMPHNYDQIANLINELKTNPDSRRLMVNAWNVGELDQMTLPPCHYGFQVYTRELSWQERRELLSEDIARGRVLDKNGLNQGDFGDISPFTEKIIHYWMNQFNIPTRAISLMWNQRSVDTFLGLPFNIASYGLLLQILAKEVNMVPDELIGNLGDTHLYLNHIEQAKEQIGRELSLDERTELAKGKVVPLLGSKEDSYNEAGIPTRSREPFPLPKLLCLDEYHYLTDEELVGVIPFTEKIKEFRPDFFTMGNYQSHATIKAPLSN